MHRWVNEWRNARLNSQIEQKDMNNFMNEEIHQKGGWGSEQIKYESFSGRAGRE